MKSNGDGKQTREVILAILERFIQRGTTALLTLTIAYIGGPSDLGVYATALVVLTLYQAVFESPFRQVGVTMQRFVNGDNQLKGMGAVLAVGGVPFLFISILIIAFPHPWEYRATFIIALVPVFSAWGLRALTTAQRGGTYGWALIAKSQLVATIISLVCVAPLIATNATFAASAQLVLSEACFAVVVRRGSRRIVKQAHATTLGTDLTRSYVIPTVMTSIFGWSQTQLERLVLVIFAPTAAVGIYSLSVAASRTVSDAATLGSVNAVRAHISLADAHSKADQLVSGSLRTQWIATAMQTVVGLACVFVLPHILGPRWHTAISLAPLFGASAAILGLSWTISAYLIEVGRSRDLLGPQLIGIVMSIGVGFCLYQSLVLGAAVSMLRDFVSTALRFYLIRQDISFRSGLHLALAGCALVPISISLYIASSYLL